MKNVALQNTIEILTEDAQRVRHAIDFANLTSEFSKTNPPENIWQGLGHICLGTLAVSNLVLSGAVLVHDIDLMLDGKPLRKQIPITPTQNRLSYRRLNRLSAKKRSARPQLGVFVSPAK